MIDIINNSDNPVAFFYVVCVNIFYRTSYLFFKWNTSNDFYVMISFFVKKKDVKEGCLKNDSKIFFCPKYRR